MFIFNNKKHKYNVFLLYLSVFTNTYIYLKQEITSFSNFEIFSIFVNRLKFDVLTFFSYNSFLFDSK